MSTFGDGGGGSLGPFSLGNQLCPERAGGRRGSRKEHGALPSWEVGASVWLDSQELGGRKPWPEQE